LKALADVYGCPIITASQATREAATEERVRVDQQGKAVGISQAVDLTIAIDQTPEEKIAKRHARLRAKDWLIRWMKLDSQMHCPGN